MAEAATGGQSLAAAVGAQLAAVQAELAVAQGQLAASEQAAASLRAEEQQLRAQLRQQQQGLQQQLDRLAAAAAQKDAALAALERERDGLLADQQQLVGAVAAQQAQLQAVLDQHERELAAGHGCSGSGAAVHPPAAAAAASPVPAPSLDVTRMLRDQKEALNAQHEATVTVGCACLAVVPASQAESASRALACSTHKRACPFPLPASGMRPPRANYCLPCPLPYPCCLPQDMRDVMTQEVALLAAQLAGLQRERDNALAEQSFAQEEARAAAISQERALGAARQAQRQLLTERDAVMGSLAELQAAFNAAEGKRAAEMRRLKQQAEAKQREAEALRAQLEQRAAQLAALGQAQQQQQQAAVATAPAAPAVALAGRQAQGGSSRAGQEQHPQHLQQRRYAADDMEGDLVLQRSLDPRASSQGGAGALMPLQAVRQAARDNMVAGQQPQQALQKQQQQQRGPEGGWGAGYENAFQVCCCARECHCS